MNARLSWTLSDELIGSKAGPYRITAMLGRGGMGSVFEGKHELIGSRVAIKVMAADSVGCLVSLKRFYREAKVVARIGHHGIVNIFDILSLDDGRPCLVMEMLEGSSLLDVLRRTGPLAPALALKWTEGFLDALEAAHQAGVLHRDIKPSNLFITSTGRTKLIDFGIAHAQLPGEAVLTKKGEQPGTLAYMSTEQLLGRKLDVRSDLFSLAAVLYGMLVGKAPFTPKSEYSLWKQQMEGPQRPSDFGLPAAVDAFFERALAPERSKRMSSAAEMREALCALRPLCEATSVNDTIRDRKAQAQTRPVGAGRLVAAPTIREDRPRGRRNCLTFPAMTPADLPTLAG